MVANMILSVVTAESVHKAIAECDRLGRERFLRQYGYRAALEYELEYGGRRYDSKAIVGVAYRYATGEDRPSNFSGGEQTVVRRLGELGFTVARLSADGPGRSYWWQGVQGERFWIEIRRVPEGFGRELRCPLVDADGHRNGWWDLVDDVQAGDCIYHWNADQGRFVGRSFAVRRREIDDQTGERVVPLTGFLPLTVTVGLDQIRGLSPQLAAMRDVLAGQHPGATLYLPFQTRRDGWRLMSNYFTKLPSTMQQALFGEGGLSESGLPDPPEDDGPAVSEDDNRRSKRGGFLRPFKPRADTAYLAKVMGGPARRGRTHETLVNDFADWLATQGLTVGCNAAIDLGLEDPPVIIEAKVIRTRKWAHALREAIGQLYEYRYFQVVSPQSSLIFLASAPIPTQWLDYLDHDREIGAAWRSDHGFELTNRARRALEI
jgi:hypothetical protein